MDETTLQEYLLDHHGVGAELLAPLMAMYNIQSLADLTQAQACALCVVLIADRLIGATPAVLADLSDATRAAVSALADTIWADARAVDSGGFLVDQFHEDAVALSVKFYDNYVIGEIAEMEGSMKPEGMPGEHRRVIRTLCSSLRTPTEAKSRG